MQWEILIAVILTIGICIALNEARSKRVARENEAKAIQSKQHSDIKTLNKR